MIKHWKKKASPLLNARFLFKLMTLCTNLCPFSGLNIPGLGWCTIKLSDYVIQDNKAGVRSQHSSEESIPLLVFSFANASESLSTNSNEVTKLAIVHFLLSSFPKCAPGREGACWNNLKLKQRLQEVRTVLPWSKRLTHPKESRPLCR